MEPRAREAAPVNTYRFKSVRHALGHYLAKRSGPKARDGRMVERVQDGHTEGIEWIMVGALVFGPRPFGLGMVQGSLEAERLLRWASRPDGSDNGTDVEWSALRKLRGLMVQHGLIVEPVEPAAIEPHTWVDETTGKTQTTKKLRE